MSGRIEHPARAETWRAYVGHKVSIRWTVRNDPQYPFSEGVGVVQSAEPDSSGVQTLTILNRRNETVSVPIGDVLAAKAF
ncbi:MAG: hypothetical protein H0U16_00410 [Actinobacteria bacterium]|nr:hypothetical protein [Actinomycetota bacterium]